MKLHRKLMMTLLWFLIVLQLLHDNHVDTLSMHARFSPNVSSIVKTTRLCHRTMVQGAHQYGTSTTQLPRIVSAYPWHHWGAMVNMHMLIYVTFWRTILTKEWFLKSITIRRHIIVNAYLWRHWLVMVSMSMLIFIIFWHTMPTKE